MNNDKINYIKNFGFKATVLSEYFKQNELNGNTITDTQAKLIKTEIVKSRMLDNYTKTYEENKDKIGWVK